MLSLGYDYDLSDGRVLDEGLDPSLHDGDLLSFSDLWRVDYHGHGLAKNFISPCYTYRYRIERKK